MSLPFFASPAQYREMLEDLQPRSVMDGYASYDDFLHSLGLPTRAQQEEEDRYNEELWRQEEQVRRAALTPMQRVEEDRQPLEEAFNKLRYLCEVYRPYVGMVEEEQPPF